jgi:hypothetical protein
MKALIYDIEIKKAIPDKNKPREDGIEYCEDWHDHANMGISVIGAYDYATDRYHVFCDDNKDAFFEACLKAECLVSFNGIGFDNRVIEKTWSFPDSILTKFVYDLLVETWVAAGLGPKFAGPSHGGFGLDAICSCNFGTKKSGNGALAPVLWQRGKIGEVIDYCLNDVRLTKQIFDKVLADRSLISPKDGRELTLRQPA